VWIKGYLLISKEKKKKQLKKQNKTFDRPGYSNKHNDKHAHASQEEKERKRKKTKTDHVSSIHTHTRTHTNIFKYSSVIFNYRSPRGQKKCFENVPTCL